MHASGPATPRRPIRWPPRWARPRRLIRCLSVPSIPTSTWSRSKTACSTAGAPRRHRRVRGACARTPSPGSSTRGRPTANGRPGLHHVWARVFKDLYPRFQTMRGHSGAPQGRLGLPRPARRARGREGARPALQARDRGLRRRRVQPALPRLGAALRRGLVRAHHPLRHLDRHRRRLLDAVERLRRVGVVAALAAVGEGPALRGPQGQPLLRPLRHRPVVARAGPARRATATSIDPSVYVRFPRHVGPRHPPRAPTCWCGPPRPWTLISNVAAAVGPDIDYVRVPAERGRRAPGRDLIVADAARARRCPEGAERGRPPGRARAGRARTTSARSTCSTPPPVPTPGGWWRPTTSAPTTARASCTWPPPSARTTRRSARAEGLPVLNPVDADGAFDHRVPAWQGLFVKDADRRHHRRPRRPRPARARAALRAQLPPLLALRHPAHLLGQDVVVRPHVRPARRAARARTRRINWQPDHIKHGRFGKWLEGNVDWALSRDRYWGTPLPIWRCTDAATTRCIGSVAELAELAGPRPRPTLDLHRPYVDDITFACTECGGTATAGSRPCSTPGSTRASMPSAQRHYPFEGADGLPPRPSRPTSSARPSTRPAAGSTRCSRSTRWCSTRAPYRNVVCLNLIVDENGQKMSKSKGNIIAPVGHLLHPGRRRPALVLLLRRASPGRHAASSPTASASPPARPCSPCGTCFSLLRHLRRPRRLGARTPTARPARRPTCSTAGSSASSTTRSPPSPTALEGFDALAGVHPAGRLHRRPVELVRAPLAGPASGSSSDPAAHATLHECLVTVAQLLAPFCPFLADAIYTDRSPARPSVHLSDWPEPLGRGRRRAGRRRWPPPAAWWPSAGPPAPTPRSRCASRSRRALLLHPGVELDDGRRRRDPLRAQREVARAHRHAVGPHQLDGGAQLPDPGPPPRAHGSTRSRHALAAADGSALQQAARGRAASSRSPASASTPTTSRSGPSATRPSPWPRTTAGPWPSTSRSTTSCAREGQARELVRALNDLRKALGLAIADRVRGHHRRRPTRLQAAVDAHRDWIAGEVLATSLSMPTGSTATPRTSSSATPPSPSPSPAPDGYRPEAFWVRFAGP